MESEHKHFPFLGLHVYHRAQEAWTKATHGQGSGNLRRQLEAEVRNAVLGIARATARPGWGSSFRADLETARAALHAAGAIADQLTRHGSPVDEELQGLLSDSARMLGALIRTLGVAPAPGPVPGSQNGTPATVEP